MKISLGAGGVRLPGWIHVDFDLACLPDIQADLSAPLPLASRSADFLQSEDFIGQLTFEQASEFLAECYRVLKPGGVLRVLTPDLDILARLYLDRNPRLRMLWEKEVGIPLVVGTLGEVVHKALTFADQRSFYDEETLRALLVPIGFSVKRMNYGESDFEDLRGVDLRSPATAISLYLDCIRPAVY